MFFFLDSEFKKRKFEKIWKRNEKDQNKANSKGGKYRKVQSIFERKQTVTKMADQLKTPFGSVGWLRPREEMGSMDKRKRDRGKVATSGHTDSKRKKLLKTWSWRRIGK